MRVYKVIIIGIIMTVTAVLYVHQHVEIVKAGYAIQRSRKHLSYLVDQNSKLMYNLSKLESPRYLLASLDSEEVVFANHRIEHLENVQLEPATLSDKNTSKSFMGKFFDFLTLNAEAEPRR